jgi:hypothetical protein
METPSAQQTAMQLVFFAINVPLPSDSISEIMSIPDTFWLNRIQRLMPGLKIEQLGARPPHINNKISCLA